MTSKQQQQQQQQAFVHCYPSQHSVSHVTAALGVGMLSLAGANGVKKVARRGPRERRRCFTYSYVDAVTGHSVCRGRTHS